MSENFRLIRRREIHIGQKITEAEQQRAINFYRALKVQSMVNHLNISMAKAFDWLPLTGRQNSKMKSQMERLRMSNNPHEAFVYQRMKDAEDIARQAKKNGQRRPA